MLVKMLRLLRSTPYNIDNLLHCAYKQNNVISEALKTPNNKVQNFWIVTQQRSRSTQTGKIFEANLLNANKNKDGRISPMGWLLLLAPITTFGLGCWQVKRKIWKEELIKQLHEQTEMPAVPLPDNLEDLNNMEYRTVQVRGRFLHDKEIILGPRSFIRPDGAESAGGLFSQQNASTGYHIITPFQLSDRNNVILINRGWVPRNQVNPEQREAGQCKGEVEITGVVRLAEARPQFSPEQRGNIFLYRDLPKMCELTNAEPFFLDQTYESSIPGGPIGGQTRVTLRN